MAKEEIKVRTVPDPSRPISRGVMISNPKKLIFLSARGRREYAGMREQTMAIYKDITELLDAAGATWGHVVKILLLFKESKNKQKEFEEFDRARMDFFRESGIKPPYPASTGIWGGLVEEDYLVHIDVTAVID
jgi:enamine deaminase RidA (YjgF/YER057c/UK114 family)